MKSLDLHIIDITHKSIRAGATQITIEMEDSAARDLLSIKIIDNGCGMPEDMIAAINDRFYSCRKERKIGMGIALLKFHSQMCNGRFYLKSKVGEGTEIYASYQRSHIDLQPKGDLSGCFANFICQYQDINFIQSSDAHYVPDIAKIHSVLEMPSFSFDNFKDALRQGEPVIL